jgi:signal transduction histidine kinase/ActR/RegA family two-component response regulator
MTSRTSELNAFLVGVSDAVRDLTDPGVVARAMYRVVAELRHWTREELAGTPKHAPRPSEARNAYLVRLGDALRPLGDAAAVKRAATQAIGEQLGVNRAFYCEFDGEDLLVDDLYEQGVPPLPLGRHPGTPRAQWIRDAFHAGKNVIIQDIRSDLRFEPAHRQRNLEMHLVAAVAVPMVKDGGLVAALTVHSSAPRRWTRDEIALLAETAERTWEAVERARAAAALLESEQVARSLLSVAVAARAQAEAANRAKDEFLATLGHELRTPLAAILLWARALRAGGVQPSELPAALDAIVQSAESQSRLIDDLLDLSRLTSGRIELQRSAVDVQQVVEQAVEMVKPTAAAKNVAVMKRVEQAMGLAWLDERRLKQVLWNLLSNAVKFTPSGGTVTVSAAKAGGRLEIEVADDGEGIDAAFLPHVFEKFRQADMAHTRSYMGLGIGLTIAKRLTELHEGVIEAESEGLGRGATFRIRLPWVPAREASTPRVPPPRRPLDGLRVLLVEDDASTRLAMESSLKNAGAEVTPFADASEVLAAMESGLGVDVIVSDLAMPRISGLQLIAELGRLYESRGECMPPSLAVSAHARDIDRRAAIDAGFDLYLAKPTTPERLIEAVADLGDLHLRRTE